jgi:hypothetical protein
MLALVSVSHGAPSASLDPAFLKEEKYTSCSIDSQNFLFLETAAELLF